MRKSPKFPPGVIERAVRTVCDAKDPYPSQRAAIQSIAVASVHRLASMRDRPAGALNWLCPRASDLALREDALRSELSISPRYFKAYSALLAAFRWVGSPGHTAWPLTP